MLHHTSPAERFKRSVQVSRQFLPRHAQQRRLPRKQWPKAIAREYLQQIQVYLEGARALVEREIGPMLPSLAAAGRTDEAARLDAGQSEFNKKMDELSKTFFDKLPTAEIERLAEDFARRTSGFEKTEAMKEIRAAFGVDVMAAEPNLAGKTENFIAENVALIKSIPSQFFDDVEKHVMRAVREAQSPEQLSKVIADRYGVAQDRATLIARDQLGKFYGEVAGARQQALGVTHYIWRTSNDERVREEHNAREGQSFSWDDPPEDGHPGEAINCRCFAEPDLTPLLSGDEPLDQTPEPVESVEAQPERAPEPSPEDLARAQAREAEAETARVREAHAEEVSKRLAEQEIARENMRLLQESMERQRLEAEAAARAAAEAQARAEAEAARARAEQEAIARAAAEAEARRLADAEAARLAAVQAAKPPLRDEHLAKAVFPDQRPAARSAAEKAMKDKAKLIQEREDHLDKMRAEPPSMAALADDLRDIQSGGSLSEQAQRDVREHLNRIVGQEGVRIQENDLRKQDGDVLRAGKPGELPANAGAIHTWEGAIIVAKPETLGQARDFASNVATNPHHYREEAARIHAETAAQNDQWSLVNKEHKELNARRNELVGKKRLSKAEKSEKAELDLKLDDVLARAEVLRAVDLNLRDSQVKMENEIHNMNVLVHETMHGHSPMTGWAYKHEGVPVEEIATELASRATLAKQFGVPDTANADHWKGTYSWYIDPAIEHSANAARIATGAEVSPAESYAKLQAASIAMKQDHTVIAATPEKHFELFANKLADAYGLPEGRKRDGFITRLETAFRDDIQHRTP